MQNTNNSLLTFCKSHWKVISFIFTTLLIIGFALMILSDLGFVQHISYNTIVQNELLLGLVYTALYVVMEKN